MFIEPKTTGPDRNPAIRVHIGALAFNQTLPSWRRAGPVVFGFL